MTDILTPVGRLVWGNPLIARPKTNAQTRQPVLDKLGKPVMQWSFGLAITKAEFTQYVWPIMHAEALKGFPAGQFPPNFAWKFKDGDSVDGKGKRYAEREGYAGNVVLGISTEAFAPRVMVFQGGAWVEIKDGMKTGDYIRASLDIAYHAANPSAPGAQAGLYINPRLLQWVGTGEAIVSGADPEETFGKAPLAALPPGAVPLGQAPAAPGGLPPMPGQPPAGAPALPYQPAPAAPMAATPAYPTAPAAALPAAPLAAPAAPAYPQPTAYPSNPPQMPGMAPAAPVAPYPQFVQQVVAPAAPVAARQPVAFDQTNGRPIYGFNPANGQPIYE